MIARINFNIFCTIVIPTRNDDYSGVTSEKFSFYLRHLANQLKNSVHNFEIIIVEWNTIINRLSIKSELMHKFDEYKNISIRFISVDKQYHSNYLFSNLKPYCGEGAVNVGIRRARGRFCVVKVHDSKYSDPLGEWLSQGSARHGYIYRANRVDYLEDPTNNQSELSEDLNIEIVYSKSDKDRYHTLACGDFMLMPTEIWHKIRGWSDSKNVVKTGYDGLTLAKSIGNGMKEYILPDNHKLIKIGHPNTYVKRSVSNIVLSSPNCFNSIIQITKKMKNYKIFFIFYVLISGLLNIPRKKAFGVPVDSWSRYILNFQLRLYFSKFFYFDTVDWGLLNQQLEEIYISKIEV